jgi:hypothetical protein
MGEELYPIHEAPPAYRTLRAGHFTLYMESDLYQIVYFTEISVSIKRRMTVS